MTEGPIDEYLDALFRELRRARPRDACALLSEAESHLRDAAEEAEGKGMSAADAELDAIKRFGGADQLARSDRNRGMSDLARSVVVSAWSLGALGAIAVGASGLVAGMMRLVGASNEFVAGGRATAGLAKSDCARWLRILPACPVVR